jgi:alpha-tubulin suppressor-like RCC1 family protein
MARLANKFDTILIAVFAVVMMSSPSSTQAGNNVYAWGAGTIDNPSDGYDFGQSIVPANLTNAIQLAGGGWHSLALKADGTLQGWGRDDLGQADAPSGSNFVAVACGAIHSLALQANGLVVAFGDTSYGQSYVPANLSNVVAIACGFCHSLALKSDGTVTAWGADADLFPVGQIPNYGQTVVPAGLTNVVAIAAGGYHSLALGADGTLTEWGDQASWGGNIPSGLSNAVAIATGAENNIVLTRDGTLTSWGTSTYGETNIPSGLSNIVAIVAGSWHTLALTKGGKVVGWGAGTGNRGPIERGQDVVPSGLTNVVQMAAGMYHSLIRQGDSPPTVTAPLAVDGITSNTFNLTVPSQAGRVYQLEYVASLNQPYWFKLPLCAGNGGILDLVDPSGLGATQRFYRLNRW